MVERVAGAQKAWRGRLGVERLEQILERAQIEGVVAPAQLPERREVVALHRQDGPGVEPADVGRGAEGAVAHVAPGAAGDLADLVGVQPAPLAAVELDQAGQRDVGEIHVQAHADGVGRDQVVDLAGLIQRHLGVAGARAQRAQDHRGAAAAAAHQLGERVDLLGGERDHRAAPRQAGHLGRLDVGERGEARPADQLRLGHQLADQRPDRVGAEEHGLVAAARVQQPVGEHVAALGIGAQLDLVDREEARPRGPRGMASTVATK